jgi:hypothetical protein
MISTIESLNYKARVRKQLFLFLILPLASLINAFKYKNLKIITNTIWAFVVFHGFTLIIYSEGIDAARYAEKLENLHNQPITWYNFLLSFFSSQNVDIIEPLLSYGVSLFTDNSRVLFLVYGIVFGYFYSRNIGYLIKNVHFKYSKSVIFLITIFALTIPFWEINGVRMWTAAHIFFFAAVRIIDGKFHLKNIVLLLLAPLMHFSFVLPVTVLMAFKILGNRPLLYYISFLFTFLISEIELGAVREIVTNYTPEFLNDRVVAYTQDNQMENIKEQALDNAFYIRYQGIASKIGMIILLSYLVALKKTLRRVSPKAYNYLSFSLFFLSIANLISLIPSGGRFLSVAYLFAITTFLLFWGAKHFQVKPLLLEKIAFSCFFFSGFISLWKGFQTMSVMLVIGNPVFALFSNLETSLAQVIKLEFL